MLLTILFNVLILTDISNCYAVAKTNRDTINSDSSIVKVKNYDTDSSGVCKITDEDNNKYTVNNPNVSITLVVDKDNKDSIWYSIEGDTIMHTVGLDYYARLLMDSNTIPVIICWTFVCLILFYCVSTGDFSVLSKKITLILNMLTGFILGVVIICGYVAFRFT